VVAADGGNSKTDLVLATTGGRVLARVRGAGTNAHRDGFDGMAAGLAALTGRARAEAGLPPEAAVEVGVFHLASVDLPGEDRRTVRELRKRIVVGEIVVANDVFAVLRAGASTGWGVAVVAGAGINAVGLHPAGRVARFLAIGELSGDWGGGLAVGTAALAAAVRAGDGRGPATVLRDRIAATGLASTAEGLAVALYQGRLPRLALLDLAPVALAAAHDGDPVAASIVDRLAGEVAGMALALLRRLRLLRSDAEVILGGGMLQSGSALVLGAVADRLHAVAPAARLAMLRVPPVVGTLEEALRRAGASPGARRHARASFPPTGS
jgi:N-acetylglucosamine kinase-like BadF-type ATPase